MLRPPDDFQWESRRERAKIFQIPEVAWESGKKYRILERGLDKKEMAAIEPEHRKWLEEREWVTEKDVRNGDLVFVENVDEPPGPYGRPGRFGVVVGRAQTPKGHKNVVLVLVPNLVGKDRLSLDTPANAEKEFYDIPVKEWLDNTIQVPYVPGKSDDPDADLTGMFRIVKRGLTRPDDDSIDRRYVWPYWKKYQASNPQIPGSRSGLDWFEEE
jgi:hypothetical protein